MESITCDSCCGTKEIFNGKDIIKCTSCNGTGEVIIKNFTYKVPSDINKIITKIYDDRISREIIELERLAKVDIKLKQNTNNYTKS